MPHSLRHRHLVLQNWSSLTHSGSACAHGHSAMTATAPAPSPAVGTQVVFIETPCGEPVLRLLGDSRWRAEPVPDIGAAVSQIGRGSVPVVICGARDWR